MGLFDRFRRKPEVRAVTSLPWNVGAPTWTDTASQQRALTLTPVFAANRHIVDQISTLPLKAYRRQGDERTPMGTLPLLLRALHDEGRLVPWLSQAVASMVLRGNAVGLVTARDGMGFPSAAVWLPMDDVTVDDTGPRPTWWWQGRMLDRSEVIHIPWLTVPGRTLGLSPIEHFAATVNQGLGATEYATGWFDAGGVPPGTFKNTEKTVTQDEADAIKQRLVSAIRSRKPIVYGADWDYTAISIPPEQAQFVQTSKLTANQIAAIYGLDPTEVGGEAANSMTYANEEHRQITRLQNLRPWMVRLEYGLSAHLPTAQYVRFNVDATIRVDTLSRWSIHKTAVDMGARSVNEVRALEDEPPILGGDSYSIPMSDQQRNGWVVPDTPNELLRREKVT